VTDVGDAEKRYFTGDGSHPNEPAPLSNAQEQQLAQLLQLQQNLIDSISLAHQKLLDQQQHLIDHLTGVNLIETVDESDSERAHMRDLSGKPFNG
jgi:ribosome-binding protein aMBF1 (putative translation factor)